MNLELIGLCSWMSKYPFMDLFCGKTSQFKIEIIPEGYYYGGNPVIKINVPHEFIAEKKLEKLEIPIYCYTKEDLNSFCDYVVKKVNDKRLQKPILIKRV